MKKYYAKVGTLELAAGELPNWYLIFPAGLIDLEYGPSYIVDEVSYNAVVEHYSRRGLDPVVDYEHQTMSGGEAPAAGWIKEWKWDETGIHARIEWTARAEERIKALEYRYYSPVFELVERDKEVYSLFAVHNVGLTNDPRTNNLKPLIAKAGQHHIQEDEELKLLASLIALSALGLAEDATEEDAVTVITAKLTELEQQEKGAGPVVSAKIAGALGLTENPDETLVLAKISTLEASATSDGSTAAELKELKEELAGQKAEQLMAKYSDRITPAMAKKENAQGEPLFLTLAKNDPKNFVTLAETMPVQIPGKLPGKQKGGGDGELDETQLMIAKNLGLTKEEFLAELKREEG